MKVRYFILFLIVGSMVAVVRGKQVKGNKFLYKHAVELMTRSWAQLDQAVHGSGSYVFKYDLVLAAVGDLARVQEFFCKQSNLIPANVSEDADFWYNACSHIQQYSIIFNDTCDGYGNVKRLILRLLLDIKNVFVQAQLDQLL
ncbi:hypothetical protein IPH25_04355 [bacterium]|nr:MAG: hypothetical protein IPG37_01350 [bacterium]QQR61679.1 MAG: hypothetical protein IPH25_04355 [bacterium]QQR62754.1 MAG: hypothetical protein IPH67_05085 [bacterium]